MVVPEGFNTADVKTRVSFIKPRPFCYGINWTNKMMMMMTKKGLWVRVKVVELLLMCHPCLECMLRLRVLGLHHTLRRNMVSPLINPSKKYVC